MDEATQREIARKLVNGLNQQGIDPVLVGSSAVIALDLFPRASKDADALAPPSTTLDEGRRVMREIGKDYKLEPTETGDQTVSLVMRDSDGLITWRMDLLVPGAGLIPVATAALVHKHAKATPIGRAAIPEHILVMKAVAWGDSIGKGRAGRVTEYEADVLRMRDLRPSLDMKLVQEILKTFPDARRDPAIRLINKRFGTTFSETFDPNI